MMLTDSNQCSIGCDKAIIDYVFSNQFPPLQYFVCFDVFGVIRNEKLYILVQSGNNKSYLMLSNVQFSLVPDNHNSRYCRTLVTITLVRVLLSDRPIQPKLAISVCVALLYVSDKFHVKCNVFSPVPYKFVIHYKSRKFRGQLTCYTPRLVTDLQFGYWGLANVISNA